MTSGETTRDSRRFLDHLRNLGPGLLAAGITSTVTAPVASTLAGSG